MYLRQSGNRPIAVVQPLQQHDQRRAACAPARRKVRIALEDAGVDHARRHQRGVEHQPDAQRQLELAHVGRVLGEHRMLDHRQAQPLIALPQRLEARVVERRTADVGAEREALQAERRRQRGRSPSARRSMSASGRLARPMKRAGCARQYSASAVIDMPRHPHLFIACKGIDVRRADREDAHLDAFASMSRSRCSMSNMSGRGPRDSRALVAQQRLPSGVCSISSSIAGSVRRGSAGRRNGRGCRCSLARSAADGR